MTGSVTGEIVYMWVGVAILDEIKLSKVRFVSSELSPKPRAHCVRFG